MLRDARTTGTQYYIQSVFKQPSRVYCNEAAKTNTRMDLCIIEVHRQRVYILQNVEIGIQIIAGGAFNNMMGGRRQRERKRQGRLGHQPGVD